MKNETRVILIGGSSHIGKSTLGQSFAMKLAWSYLSTDKLARHPGRPWLSAKVKAIPKHVAQHYANLSVDALFFDVLSHYKKNVLPQIQAIVHSHIIDLKKKCLILEGSALWPEFVTNLVGKNGIKAIWLTASDRFFSERIKRKSNYDNVSENEKYLIQKFLDRTLYYNRRMMEEIDRLRFICIDVETVSTLDELAKKCMELLEISEVN